MDMSKTNTYFISEVPQSCPVRALGGQDPCLPLPPGGDASD